MVNASDATPSAKMGDGRLVGLFCIAAALHCFLFAAAFPFFNNVDEANHFDLVMKYASGHPPAGMEVISPRSMPYIAVFGSQEYLWPTNLFAGGQYPPPPWKQSTEEMQRYLAANELNRTNIINYEDGQPPLYYGLAAAWAHVGRWLGFGGGAFLYWIRFLNLGLVAAMVYLGYLAAREMAPENRFLTLAVPAFLAFFPQTALYSLENDVLAPICFGVAFVGLLQLTRADGRSAALQARIGLALAAAYLTKVSNLPLVLAATAAWAWIAARGLRQKRFPATPGLAFLISLAVPVGLWMAWSKIAFGDITGSAEKIKILHWTVKPFAQWWSHPLFTPRGAWTFLSGLSVTFWQGDILWGQKPLNLPWLNAIYLALTFTIPVVSIVAVGRMFRRHHSSPETPAIVLSALFLAAAVAFLALLSIVYDFHDCFYPSRAHPYFTSGRLMLGALIPFALLFVDGLDRVTRRLGSRPQWAILAALVLLMLGGEIATDWPVFFSRYNWYHL
ncbi:MAG TPA: DUF2142 domain-containing protein [Verrucomicrobiae bacterium]|nr:DUF2142 domain-containing protein [Verrucomicrobiae bacterium]